LWKILNGNEKCWKMRIENWTLPCKQVSKAQPLIGGCGRIKREIKNILWRGEKKILIVEF
jgi:hypothetical protein